MALTWGRLVAVARRVGVKVVEAPSSHRGHLGSMGTVAGCVCHHTGTPNSYAPTDDYPDFNVVKEGRAGLNNSLSAYGVGRRDAIYVFSEFLSWHAGAWSYAGITDGNGHFLGIECAGVGDYTEFQRRVYPRLVAAILLEIGAPQSMAPRHLDGAMPRGRKSDAANLDGNFYQGKTFYQWVDFFMANPAYININYGDGGTFLMALSDAQQVELYQNMVATRSYLDTMYRWMRGGDPNVDNLTLIWLQNNATQQQIAKVLEALVGGNTDGKNNFHWLADLIISLFKQADGVEIDEDKFRDMIVDAVHSSVSGVTADDVLKVIAERISNSDINTVAEADEKVAQLPSGPVS